MLSQKLRISWQNSLVRVRSAIPYCSSCKTIAWGAGVYNGMCPTCMEEACNIIERKPEKTKEKEITFMSNISIKELGFICLLVILAALFLRGCIH